MVSQLGCKQGLDLEQADGRRGQREGWVATVKSPARQERRKDSPHPRGRGVGWGTELEKLNPRPQLGVFQN